MFARTSVYQKLLAQAQNVFSKNCIKDIIKLPACNILSHNIQINRSTATFQNEPENEQLKKKKKTIPVPKITLLNGQDMSISTLEEAQKIAKRRSLKLVKILDLDTKTERAVYRLMTGAEYHQEDLKQRELKKKEKQKNAFKGEKVLIVGQNISEHDLQININKILKWLAKKYEVIMVINGNSENNSKAENIYSFIEKNVGSQGRIVQKRQKGSDTKFQILPPKETTQNSSNNQDKSGGQPNSSL